MTDDGLTGERTSVSTRRLYAFAILFGAESLSRSLVVALIPTIAHRLLGSAYGVSVLYFLVGLVGLASSFAVPAAMRHVSRKLVFSSGSCAACVGFILIGTETYWGLVAGLALATFSISAIDITLALYVLELVSRRSISRYEPIRVFCGGIAWLVGPYLGAVIATQFHPTISFMLSGAVALAQLGLFLSLKLPAPAVIATRSGATVVNPLRHLRRFLAQPRLRLAWLLAFSRAGWWQMFFVYGPIFVVTAGLGQEAAGAMISIGAGALLLVPVWGWFGRRYGLRRLLLVGYSLTGLLTLAVAALADLPMTGVAVLVVAVFTASLIDGAGNVPFLRSVRVWERPEMTGVFTTYRQMAQFAPPGFFAILLKMFELPAVFVASGIGMLILAGFTRYLPRRM